VIVSQNCCYVPPSRFSHETVPAPNWGPLEITARDRHEGPCMSQVGAFAFRPDDFARLPRNSSKQFRIRTNARSHRDGDARSSFVISQNVFAIGLEKTGSGLSSTGANCESIANARFARTHAICRVDRIGCCGGDAQHGVLPRLGQGLHKNENVAKTVPKRGRRLFYVTRRKHRRNKLAETLSEARFEPMFITPVVG